MKSYLDIPGWFDWVETYKRIIRELPGGILVEVGCYLGRSLCCLGQLAKESGKPFKVIGVDHCLGSGEENGKDHHSEAVRNGGGNFASQLLRNVLDCELMGTVSLILSNSTTAANFFPDNSLQMVFLDAQHEYQSVKTDILAWLPKVKRGGIIGGDDMGVPGEAFPVWPGVRDGVNACLKNWEYTPHDAWLWYKR